MARTVTRAPAAPTTAVATPPSTTLLGLGLSVWRWLITLGVGLAAFALRWPYLLLVPRLTDETAEIRWAWRIAQGEILPLTHTDTYYGAVHPYLLAALFQVFGPHPALPRALNTVAGALLTALVAWLAWGLAERRLNTRTAIRTPATALLASTLSGLLIATSFPLIIINSHIAWSNGLTPLFTTAALGLTWAAVVDRRGWRLIAAGLTWGLAVQTHPAVVTLLPGVAAWIVWQPTGRTWLRARWPWLAGMAFLLGYSNMLIHNLLARGESVDEALNPQNAYRLASSIADYLAQLGALVLQLARMLAGSYALQPDGSIPLLITPWTLVYGLVALAALIWTARDRDLAILPLLVASSALLLPLVSRAFTALYDTRYIAMLLPPVYLALSLAAAHLWTRWQTPGRAGLLFAAAALTVIPALSLAAFYRASDNYGLTNAPLLQVAQAAQAQAADGAVVLLDRDMRPIKLGGGGDPVRAIEYLLTMNQTPHQTARPDTVNWFLIHSEAPLFLVLADSTYTQLAARYPLTATGLGAPGFGVYTALAPK